MYKEYQTRIEAGLDTLVKIGCIEIEVGENRGRDMIKPTANFISMTTKCYTMSHANIA